MPLKDTINREELLPALSEKPDVERLFPHVEESTRLLAACIPADYSASRIAHAVEDVDARLLNLNVTSDGIAFDNRLVFELRVSHRSPEAVTRSLERYGYEVIDVEKSAISDDEVMAARVAELLHYINM